MIDYHISADAKKTLCQSKIINIQKENIMALSKYIDEIKEEYEFYLLLFLNTKTNSDE